MRMIALAALVLLVGSVVAQAQSSMRCTSTRVGNTTYTHCY